MAAQYRKSLCHFVSLSATATEVSKTTYRWSCESSFNSSLYLVVDQCSNVGGCRIKRRPAGGAKLLPGRGWFLTLRALFVSGVKAHIDRVDRHPSGSGLCIPLIWGCPTPVARFWRRGGHNPHSGR